MNAHTGQPSGEHPDAGGTMAAIRVEPPWSRFAKLTAAREAFPTQACVYVQTDSGGRPLRIGRASKGLDERYHGGNGGALDAAMHGSGNLVFVAPVDLSMCKPVEEELIWQGRLVLLYNIQGKLIPPSRRLVIVHGGDLPNFADFDAFGP